MSVQGSKMTTKTLQKDKYIDNLVLKKRKGGDIFELEHELSDDYSRKSSKKLIVQT